MRRTKLTDVAAPVERVQGLERLNLGSDHHRARRSPSRPPPRSLTPRERRAVEQVAIPAPPPAPSLRSDRRRATATLISAVTGGLAAVILAAAALAGAFKSDQGPLIRRIDSLADNVSRLEGEVRALRSELGQVQVQVQVDEAVEARVEEARSHYRQGHPDRAAAALEPPK